MILLERFSFEGGVQISFAQKIISSFQDLKFMQLTFNCFENEGFSTQCLERSDFAAASSRSPRAKLVEPMFCADEVLGNLQNDDEN